LLRYFISAPDALDPEIFQPLPWIACLLPFTLISAAGAGTLESRELVLFANSIQIVTMTLAQVAPVIAAVFVSPPLRWLSPRRPWGRCWERSPIWSSSIVGYGGWMFATNVVYPALASADQSIIGSTVEVTAGLRAMPCR
jgi:hypothetical protein